MNVLTGEVTVDFHVLGKELSALDNIAISFAVGLSSSSLDHYLIVCRLCSLSFSRFIV